MNKHRSELGMPRYDGKYPIDILGAGSIAGRAEYAGKVLNEFDYTYVNSLTQTDTLAVEEYTYTFILR